MIIFLSQHFQIIDYYRHPGWVLTNTLDRPSVNTYSTSRSTLIQHLHRYYICCHLIDILVITVSRQSTNFYRHAFQCLLMHESVNTDSQLSTNSPSSVLKVSIEMSSETVNLVSTEYRLRYWSRSCPSSADRALIEGIDKHSTMDTHIFSGNNQSNNYK